MSDLDDAAEALAEIVPLGTQPTARELELAEAVANHIAARTAAGAEQEDGP